jgi:hypothetical protein
MVENVRSTEWRVNGGNADGSHLPKSKSYSANFSAKRARRQAAPGRARQRSTVGLVLVQQGDRHRALAHA